VGVAGDICVKGWNSNKSGTVGKCGKKRSEYVTVLRMGIQDHVAEITW